MVVHIPGELIDEAYRPPVEYGGSGSVGVGGASLDSSNSGGGGSSSLQNSVLAGLTDDVALAWLLGVKIVLVVGCRPQVEARLKALRQTALDKDLLSEQERLKKEEESLRLAAQATGSVGWLDNSAWIDPYNTREIREAMGEDVSYDNEFENGESSRTADYAQEESINVNGSSKKVMGAYDVSGVRITDRETLRIVKEEAGFARFEVERMLTRAMKNSGRTQYTGGGGGAQKGGTGAALPPSRRERRQRHRHRLRHLLLLLLHQGLLIMASSPETQSTARCTRALP